MDKPNTVKVKDHSSELRSNKPATALPWKPVSERANEGAGAPVETELRGSDRQVAVRLGRLYSDTQKADAAYIAHSANAYPRLVEALRYWLPDETYMDQHYPRTDTACKPVWDKFYESCALLRELGEQS